MYETLVKHEGLGPQEGPDKLGHTACGAMAPEVGSRMGLPEFLKPVPRELSEKESFY